MDQLSGAVDAVLASWEAPKAHEYRRIHDIPDDLGTAVILQRMVFGNAGGVSGAGVGFTRDPALGEHDAVHRLSSSTRRARTSSPAA